MQSLNATTSPLIWISCLSQKYNFYSFLVCLKIDSIGCCARIYMCTFIASRRWLFAFYLAQFGNQYSKGVYIEYIAICNEAGYNTFTGNRNMTGRIYAKE